MEMISIFYKTVKYLKSSSHYDVDFCTTWDDKRQNLDSYDPILYDGNFSQQTSFPIFFFT